MRKVIKLTLGAVCYVFITLSFQSCEQRAKPKTAKVQVKKEVNTEEKIAHMVMDLEEVKRKTAMVERLSKGTRTLSTYIESPPTAGDPYYCVKVAEDNGSNYVTYYTFNVSPDNYSISYYDVVVGEFIPLDQWRKTTPLSDR